MNLTIDTGNTRTKFAVFDGETIVASGILENTEQYAALFGQYPIEAVIASSVGQEIDFQSITPQQVHFHTLGPQLPLPIVIDYETPETLGPDRIAAACGAWALFPGTDCIIIDAGTCITIDHLDASGTYRGGAILPGIEMKFHALHTFTARLPLLEQIDGSAAPVTGRTTAESILAGVLTATRFAVEGFVQHYRSRCASARVLLTGGDAARLCAAGAPALQHAEQLPSLVMTGLNSLLTELNIQ